MTFTAMISRDGTKLRMAKGTWSHTVPVEELPGWLAMYERLLSRGSKKPGEPGPWAKHYAQAVDVLRALKRRTA